MVRKFENICKLICIKPLKLKFVWRKFEPRKLVKLPERSYFVIKICNCLEMRAYCGERNQNLTFQLILASYPVTYAGIITVHTDVSNFLLKLTLTFIWSQIVITVIKSYLVQNHFAECLL